MKQESDEESVVSQVFVSQVSLIERDSEKRKN
jgi:hypothetical protein